MDLSGKWNAANFPRIFFDHKIVFLSGSLRKLLENYSGTRRKTEDYILLSLLHALDRLQHGDGEITTNEASRALSPLQASQLAHICL